ncbi:molybdopterin-dependent oxidoreductase [uncultured Albimonas sp.]|uniref:molybdopterin-dependent oxidoreductase n=1 Tax=uncultured Albimonas sp. TaxID=1331701 RepID=UPI0030ED45BA|tara:strand:- start:2125 stop:2634 length:510 start_codon:yes stop_codon:yes gene_type:complete
MGVLRHLALSVAVAIAALASLPASADPAPAPVGPVLLVVDGDVDGAPVELDRAALQSLPRTEFTTSTLWTEGERAFAGVLVADLLEAVGGEDASQLTAYALNDYKVELPGSDAVSGGPIIAYEMDGAAMSVRDKGPLWIVYPYDADSRFRTEEVYSRSIWQLTRITVHD